MFFHEQRKKSTIFIYFNILFSVFIDISDRTFSHVLLQKVSLAFNFLEYGETVSKRQVNTMYIYIFDVLTFCINGYVADRILTLQVCG